MGLLRGCNRAAFLPDKNEIRTSPQRRWNATSWAGRKNDVVILGRLQPVEHRGLRLGFDHRQVSEECIDVGASAIARSDKRNVRILSRKVPTQRCRQFDRLLVGLAS